MRVKGSLSLELLACLAAYAAFAAVLASAAAAAGSNLESGLQETLEGARTIEACAMVETLSASHLMMVVDKVALLENATIPEGGCRVDAAVGGSAYYGGEVQQAG